MDTTCECWGGGHRNIFVQLVSKTSSEVSPVLGRGLWLRISASALHREGPGFNSCHLQLQKGALHCICKRVQCPFTCLIKPLSILLIYHDVKDFYLGPWGAAICCRQTRVKGSSTEMFTHDLKVEAGSRNASLLQQLRVKPDITVATGPTHCRSHHLKKMRRFKKTARA